jgi:hypothetical protein
MEDVRLTLRRQEPGISHGKIDQMVEIFHYSIYNILRLIKSVAYADFQDMTLGLF